MTNTYDGISLVDYIFFERMIILKLHDSLQARKSH